MLLCSVGPWPSRDDYLLIFSFLYMSRISSVCFFISSVSRTIVPDFWFWLVHPLRSRGPSTATRGQDQETASRIPRIRGLLLRPVKPTWVYEALIKPIGRGYIMTPRPSGFQRRFRLDPISIFL